LGVTNAAFFTDLLYKWGKYPLTEKAKRVLDIVKHFDMFNMHGDLIYDNKTNKSILIIGKSTSGKSNITSRLIKNPRFTLRADDSVIAYLDSKGILQASSNVHPSASLAPTRRTVEGSSEAYTRVENIKLGFIHVGTIIHLLVTDNIQHAKIDAGKLNDGFNDDVYSPAPKDKEERIKESKVFGVNVSVPNVKDRDYDAIAAEIMKVLPNDLAMKALSKDERRIDLKGKKVFGLTVRKDGSILQREISENDWPKNVTDITPGKSGTIDFKDNHGPIEFLLDLCTALLVLTPDHLSYAHSDFNNFEPLRGVIHNIPEGQKDTKILLIGGTNYQFYNTDVEKRRIGQIESNRMNTLQAIQQKKISPQFYWPEVYGAPIRVAFDPGTKTLYVDTRDNPFEQRLKELRDQTRGKRPEDLAMVKDVDFDKLSAWLVGFRFRGRNLFLHQEVFSINLTLNRIKKGKSLEVNFISNPGRSQLFLNVANRFSESNQPAAIPNFLRIYIRRNFKFLEIRSSNGVNLKWKNFYLN